MRVRRAGPASSLSSSSLSILFKKSNAAQAEQARTYFATIESELEVFQIQSQTGPIKLYLVGGCSRPKGRGVGGKRHHVVER